MSAPTAYYGQGPPPAQPYYPTEQQQQQQTLVSQPGPTTTVVIHQPMATPVKTWSSGICSCFDDCSICMCVTFCGPCATCQLSQEIGEFACLAFCVPNWLTAVRTKVRTQLGIQGSICDDCCMAAFCSPCAICQLWREVKNARAMGQL